MLKYYITICCESKGVFMKIRQIGDTKRVISNINSRHNYFGWPSVARLQNGKIMVAASGFRINHICPFGKAVAVMSDDEGETYSPIMTLIDTPLDDRDVGLTTFGESGLIVANFATDPKKQSVHDWAPNEYKEVYFNMVTREEIDKYVGSDFLISNDCGRTFSQIYRSPVSNPHGPCVLSDGTILWVGKYFENENSNKTWGKPEMPYGDLRTCVCYTLNPENGEMNYIGRIDPPEDTECYDQCHEPYCIEAPDGTLICHIRVHAKDCKPEEMQIFQSESYDKGKTWTTPHYLASGSPAHMFIHSSGAIVCCYGYREKPYGIRAMISYDNGKTWDMENNYVHENKVTFDMGYPCTCELPDGTLLTVFYGYLNEGDSANILQQKWTFEK